MLGMSHHVSPSIVSGEHPAAVKTRTTRRASVDMRTFQRVLLSVSSARCFCTKFWPSMMSRAVYDGRAGGVWEGGGGTNVWNETCAGGHIHTLYVGDLRASFLLGSTSAPRGNVDS